MRLRITPEKAIFFTKLSVALMFSWPPSLTATKLEISVFNTLQCASFVSSIFLFLPLLLGIYENRADPPILGKTVCLFGAVSQIVVKMIVCRVQQKRFQMLIFDMENFCRQASATERNVFQRHIDRHKYIHIVYTLWCYFTTAFVISGPLYSSQMFPTHAKYPFPVEHQPLKSIVYLHQSLVGFQAAAGAIVDCQIALLLCYATARFDILSMKLQSIKSEQDLNDCIKKHNELLRYTKEINKSIWVLVLTTILATNVAAIFGSLNFVTDQPILLKVLYFVVVATASGELFICAWPADNLMNMSAHTSLAVYKSNWFENDIKTKKKVLYFILRSQKNERIRVSAMLPSLSLPYYASYLYTSFSYFAALRIMIGTSNDS